MINKEQRVGIFVDVQNLYYSARYLYNSKVDFKEEKDQDKENKRPSIIPALENRSF